MAIGAVVAYVPADNVSQGGNMQSSSREWVILKAFIGAFSLTFIIGFVVGASERNDLARSEILSSMRLMDTGQKPYLGFKCNGKLIYSFDPDTGIVDRNPVAPPPSKVAATFSVRTHKDVILAFVGGSTGAMTLQGISKASASTKTIKNSGAQKVIATILGAVSGYLMGYWIGTFSSQDCNSIAVNSLLSEPSEWKSLGRAFYWLQLHELGYVDKRFGNFGEEKASVLQAQKMFEEDPLNRCQSGVGSALRQSIQRVDASEHVTGLDYRALTNFERSRDALYAKRAYREFADCVRILTNACFKQELCSII